MTASLVQALCNRAQPCAPKTSDLYYGSLCLMEGKIQGPSGLKLFKQREGFFSTVTTKANCKFVRRFLICLLPLAVSSFTQKRGFGLHLTKCNISKIK